MCFISSLNVWQNSGVNPFSPGDVYFEVLLIINSNSLRDVYPCVNISSSMNFSKCFLKGQSISSELLKTYGKRIIHCVSILSSESPWNVPSSSSDIRIFFIFSVFFIA